MGYMAAIRREIEIERERETIIGYLFHLLTRRVVLLLFISLSGATYHVSDALLTCYQTTNHWPQVPSCEEQLKGRKQEPQQQMSSHLHSFTIANNHVSKARPSGVWCWWRQNHRVVVVKCATTKTYYLLAVYLSACLPACLSIYLPTLAAKSLLAHCNCNCNWHALSNDSPRQRQRSPQPSFIL